MSKSEIKELPIQFDEESIKILQKVPSIHRHSLINVALSLVSKTGYYKTLSGESKDMSISESTSLESLESISSSESESTPSKDEVKSTPSKVPTAPPTDWSDF